MKQEIHKHQNSINDVNKSDFLFEVSADKKLYLKNDLQ